MWLIHIHHAFIPYNSDDFTVLPGSKSSMFPRGNIALMPTPPVRMFGSFIFSEGIFDSSVSFQGTLHCVCAESIATCWILVHFPTLERRLLILSTGDSLDLYSIPGDSVLIPEELTYNASKFHNKHCLFFAFEGLSQSKIFSA